MALRKSDKTGIRKVLALQSTEMATENTGISRRNLWIFAGAVTATLVVLALYGQEIRHGDVVAISDMELSDKELLEAATTANQGEILDEINIGKYSGVRIMQTSLCARSMCPPERQRMIIFYDLNRSDCERVNGKMVGFNFERHYESKWREVCIPKALQSRYVKGEPSSP
jgi:hypothetical protein